MGLLSCRRWCVFFLALLSPWAAVQAAPPAPTYLFPAGAQRGKTVEVTAGGSFERWPVQAWVDRPAVEVRAAKEKGKLTVAVAPDAVPGTYWIRLHDESGAGPLRPFLVGTLAEVQEQEPNDDPARPQVLPSASVVVNGRLEKAGDVDGFAVRLHKGETLVASVEANHVLGSPMDAILQVLSADGFVLAQNNDDHGLDPQVVFAAPKEDSYVVRTFAFPAEPGSGIQFAGGETYVYRLTLTTGGFADHAFPLAVPRAAPGQVEVIGWNIPAGAKTLAVKPEPASDTISLWHPQFANTVSVRVEPHPCVVGTGNRKGPQTLSLPVTVSDRIERPGDVAGYEFRAKKGQQVVFRVEAGSAGSTLDPLLVLTDGAGKRLARADDSTVGKPGTRDAGLTFGVPQDGAYRFEVRDLAGQGGFRNFYRLRAVLGEPDYALSVTTDRFVLTAGKQLAIPVAVERRNGFDREIAIAVEGLPDGVTAAPVTSSGAPGKETTLRLEAKRGPVAGPIRIIGRVAGQAALSRQATAPLGGLPGRTADLWFSVLP